MASWSDVAKPVVDGLVKLIRRSRTRKIIKWSKEPGVINELKSRGYSVNPDGSLERMQNIDGLGQS